MGNDARQALDAIDEALRERPQTDGHVLSVAAQHLSVLRDRLAAETADRQALSRVNAVISIVLACHFPLGVIPWGELEKARGWLAGLVEA